MFSAKPKFIPMTIIMKIRLNINLYALFTTCTDLTVIIVVFLKAFKTLVREIIEKNRRESRIAMNDLIPIVVDTDVKTTEVHAIHQYYITCTEIQ